MRRDGGQAACRRVTRGRCRRAGCRHRSPASGPMLSHSESALPLDARRAGSGAARRRIARATGALAPCALASRRWGARPHAGAASQVLSSPARLRVSARARSHGGQLRRATALGRRWRGLRRRRRRGRRRTARQHAAKRRCCAAAVHAGARPLRGTRAAMRARGAARSLRVLASARLRLSCSRFRGYVCAHAAPVPTRRPAARCWRSWCRSRSPRQDAPSPWLCAAALASESSHLFRAFRG